MGLARSTHGEDKLYRILVGTSLGKQPLEKLKKEKKASIKIDLGE
jgi:hypothetical protein